MKFQNSSCSREGGGLGGVKGVRKINLFFAKCICRGVGRLAGAWWRRHFLPKPLSAIFAGGYPPLKKTGILEFWAKKCLFSLMNQALTRFQSTGIFWNKFQSVLEFFGIFCAWNQIPAIPERFQRTGTGLESLESGFSVHKIPAVPERFQFVGTELESLESGVGGVAGTRSTRPWIAK